MEVGKRAFLLNVQVFDVSTAALPRGLTSAFTVIALVPVQLAGIRKSRLPVVRPLIVFVATPPAANLPSEAVTTISWYSTPEAGAYSRLKMIRSPGADSGAASNGIREPAVGAGQLASGPNRSRFLARRASSLPAANAPLTYVTHAASVFFAPFAPRRAVMTVSREA